MYSNGNTPNDDDDMCNDIVNSVDDRDRAKKKNDKQRSLISSLQHQLRQVHHDVKRITLDNERLTDRYDRDMAMSSARYNAVISLMKDGDIMMKQQLHTTRKLMTLASLNDGTYYH